MAFSAGPLLAAALRPACASGTDAARPAQRHNSFPVRRCGFAVPLNNGRREAHRALQRCNALTIAQAAARCEGASAASAFATQKLSPLRRGKLRARQQRWLRMKAAALAPDEGSSAMPLHG